MSEKNNLKKPIPEKYIAYVCDISELNDLPGAELLICARRERMLRYLHREDMARCLAAGLMLRRVFGDNRAKHILVSPLGKPYLSGGPYFNLSHSGNKVVLLVGNQELGVDIEQIVPYSQPVAQRVFTDSEQTWLKSQQSNEAFYRLWTGKESIMKAMGLGFQLPPESFEIIPQQAVPNTVHGHEWFLHWQMLEGHMLCCALSISNAKIEIISLSRVELLE